MNFKFALLAAVVAAGMSTAAVAQEQVDNGGFNGGLGDWTFSSPVNQIASDLGNVGVVDTRLPGYGAIVQVLNLTAGAYNFSFDGILNGNAGSSLIATIYNSSVGQVLFASFSGSAINGSQTGYTFDVAEAGDYTLRFYGRALGGLTSFVAVDNVSITPVVPVPGPEAGAGIAGLAMAGMYVWASRRRRNKAAA